MTNATNHRAFRASPIPLVGNQTIWTPDVKGGHVESYFLKFNEVNGSGRALWVKFTILQQLDGMALGETWAIYFDPSRNLVTAAKESRPIAACTCSVSKHHLVFGKSELKDASTKGSLETGETKIAWDIQYERILPPMITYPQDWMYRGKFPKYKTVTPYPAAWFDGTVTVNGETWKVDRAMGMQGHNWGKAHALRYAWVQCNLFEGADLAMYEGYSAQIRMGPFKTPLISAGILYVDGKTYAFDAPRVMLSRDIDVRDLSYSFQFEQDGYRLDGEIEAAAERFGGLSYINPDGSVAYCLNSKIAAMTLRLTEADSGRMVAELRSPSAAALETLDYSPDHPVRMLV